MTAASFYCFTTACLQYYSLKSYNCLVQKPLASWWCGMTGSSDIQSQTDRHTDWMQQTETVTEHRITTEAVLCLHKPVCCMKADWKILSFKILSFKILSFKILSGTQNRFYSSLDVHLLSFTWYDLYSWLGIRFLNSICAEIYSVISVLVTAAAYGNEGGKHSLSSFLCLILFLYNYVLELS